MGLCFFAAPNTKFKYNSWLRVNAPPLGLLYNNIKL